MGVHGLWDLASPAGQRVNMSALENKVIAVDASIWMYHFLKAMRDEAGEMVKGAHLLGFFRRICKLLYLKIKPVFVFDGPPPMLKMQTLAARRKQREDDERQRRKVVEKLLRNQLKKHLLQATAEARAADTADASDAADGSGATSASAPAAAGASCLGAPDAGGTTNTGDCTEPQELPSGDPDACPGDDAAASDGSASSDGVAVEEAPTEPAAGSRQWERSRWRQRRRVPKEFQGFMAKRRGVAEVVLPELPAEPLRDILGVPERRRVGRMREPDEWKGYVLPGGGIVTVPLDGPVSLEEFEGLPAKVKYDLLKRAQETWYGESRLKAVEARNDSGVFVNVQLEFFLRHVRTNKELEKAKREMAEDASRPGVGMAEGDVYRPPSFLNQDASAGAALALDASAAASDAVATVRTEAIPAASDGGAGERGRGRGPKRGRGRGGAIRQVGGQELVRLRPLSEPVHTEVLELLEETRLGAPAPPGVLGVASSATFQEAMDTDSPERSAVDIFGASFFADSEDDAPDGHAGTTSAEDTDMAGGWLSSVSPELSVALEDAEACGLDMTGGWLPADVPEPSAPVEGMGTLGMDVTGGWISSGVPEPSAPVEMVVALVLDTGAPEPSAALEGTETFGLDMPGGCLSSREQRPHADAESVEECELDAAGGLLASGTPEASAALQGLGTLRLRDPRASEQLHSVTGSCVPAGSCSGVVDAAQESALSPRPLLVSAAVLESSGGDLAPQVGHVSAGVPAQPVEAHVRWHVRAAGVSGGRGIIESPAHHEQPHFLEDCDIEESEDSSGEVNVGASARFAATQLFIEEGQASPTAPKVAEDKVCVLPRTTRPAEYSTVSVVPDESELTQSGDACNMGCEAGATFSETQRGLTSEDAVQAARCISAVNDASGILPEEARRLAAERVAKAAVAAPLPPKPGLRNQTGGTTETDQVWCPMHFQYRWRCRQDGVHEACDAPATRGTTANARAGAKAVAGSRRVSGDSDAAWGGGLGGDLADEDMEELEIGRLRAELDDEAHELREDMRRAKTGADTVTREMQAEIEGLLEAFGIPFVHAPSEAEAQCAFLAEAKLVDAATTDDSDGLVFGSPELYRRLFSDDQMVECYTSERLEARLGLVQGDLVILAMLLGCDYTLGVHGVGIVNGLEILRAFAPGHVGPGRSASDARLDAWLEELRKFRAWASNIADWGSEAAGVEPDDRRAVAEFKRSHKNIRTQWAFPSDFPNPAVYCAFTQPQVDRSTTPFSWSSVDEMRVMQLVMVSTGIAEEKLRERMEPALRRYTDTLRQPRITEYMRPSGVGEVAVVRSVRMRDALRGLQGEEVSPPRPAPKRRGRRAQREAEEGEEHEEQAGGDEGPALAGLALRPKRRRKALAAVAASAAVVQPGMGAASSGPAVADSGGWSLLRAGTDSIHLDLDDD